MYRKIITAELNRPVRFECRAEIIMSWRPDLADHIERAEEFLSVMLSPVLGSGVQEVVDVYTSLDGVWHYCVSKKNKILSRLLMSGGVSSPFLFEQLRVGWQQYAAIPAAICGASFLIPALCKEVPRFVKNIDDRYVGLGNYSNAARALYLGRKIKDPVSSPGPIIVHEAIHHLDAAGVLTKLSSYYLACGLDLVYSLVHDERINYGYQYKEQNDEWFRNGMLYAEHLHTGGALMTGPLLRRVMRFVGDIDNMNAGTFTFTWDRSSGDYYESYVHGMFYGGINSYLLKLGAPVDTLACLAQSMVLKRPLEKTLKDLF